MTIYRRKTQTKDAPRTVATGKPCVGAPKNAPWGYLACGCTSDGYGRHADYNYRAPQVPVDSGEQVG